MTVPTQFIYKCPKCGFTTVSESPGLMACTVPVYDDGQVVVLPPGNTTYGDYPRCGGDFTEWGPSVWWWQIPEDLQQEILRRENEKL